MALISCVVLLEIFIVDLLQTSFSYRYGPSWRLTHCSRTAHNTAGCSIHSKDYQADGHRADSRPTAAVPPGNLRVNQCIKRCREAAATIAAAAALQQHFNNRVRVTSKQNGQDSWLS